MLFPDLYKIAEANDDPYIRFGFLRDSITAHHNQIGRVDLQKVVYPKPINSAYYHLSEPDRTSPYDEEFAVAEIVYCSGLDSDNRERRYALTKELMHAFDAGDELANSRDRFIQLMRDVQNRPLAKHASAMFQSEEDTRWMAVLALCPRSLRDPLHDKFKAGRVVLSEVADALIIPEWVATFVMDDYYDTVYGSMIEGKNGDGHA